MTHSPVLRFPTALHRDAADYLADFFSRALPVHAVLLVNSCARGTATPESDLDLAVLIDPLTPPAERQALEEGWQQYRTGPHLEPFCRSSRFAAVHLKFIDGTFVPALWDDGGGPDDFELRLGNQVADSVPLWQRGDAYRQLRSAWLPYYDPALQVQRLTMVRSACRNDLDHVPYFVRRGLHFQAFDRLYKAFQEFLQALHIAHRRYPVAYTKWIREQVEGRLGLPDLYAQLPGLLEVRHLESPELEDKAQALQTLLDVWTARP
jgi:Nucleotidyltransferase domain